MLKPTGELPSRSGIPVIKGHPKNYGPTGSAATGGLAAGGGRRKKRLGDGQGTRFAPPKIQRDQDLCTTSVAKVVTDEDLLERTERKQPNRKVEQSAQPSVTEKPHPSLLKTRRS